MTASLLNSLSELPEYRQVLANLIARDLKVKYQSKGLGFLWSLLHPAIQIAIWYIVFTLRVIHFDGPRYWAFLISGMIAFQFVVSAIIDGAWSVRRNAGIIRKVYVPMEILVIAAVTVKLIEFVLQLAVAIAVLAVLHHGEGPQFSLFKTIVVVPAAIVLLYLFVLGVAMPLAGWAIVYRDLDHMTGLAMTSLFYITPVFWNIAAVMGSRFAIVFALNPIMHFLELIRSPLYWGTWPHNPTVGGGPAGCWIVAISFSILTFIGGYLLLDQIKHTLAEVV